MGFSTKVVAPALAAWTLAAATVVPGASPLSDYDRAAQAVAQRAAGAPQRKARNVILFVGDGMGISTVTAARILEGQLRNVDGESNRLAFEEFPQTALVRTYTADQQVSDSAPTATAMVTGWHANDGALSVATTIGRNESDAARVAAARLQTLLEQAEAHGLATGIVTTTRITDATPASNYAHTPNRFWETSGQLPAGATLSDVAALLVEHQRAGNGLEVILAGGRDVMLPNTVADPEYRDRRGRRRDGRNLIDEWVAAQPSSRFVWRREDLMAVDPRTTSHLLGLFEPGNLHYEVDRARDAAGEPSLAEMTERALQMLGKSRKGYFLMVEGGRIDHGHHAGNAYRALTDTIALSAAVRRAVELTSAGDTLILVTADHSHTLTISGYPARGNPILGLAKGPGEAAPTLDANGRPYATLSYASGWGVGMFDDGAEDPPPRVMAPGRTVDLATIDTTARDFHQEALVALRGETHGGEDVALYARGPGAELARGAINQNEIYHVMRRALGW